MPVHPQEPSHTREGLPHSLRCSLPRPAPKSESTACISIRSSKNSVGSGSGVNSSRSSRCSK